MICMPNHGCKLFTVLVLEQIVDHHLLENIIDQNIIPSGLFVGHLNTVFLSIYPLQYKAIYPFTCMCMAVQLE